MAFATVFSFFSLLSVRVLGISLVQSRKACIVRLVSHLWYIIIEHLTTEYPHWPYTPHSRFRSATQLVAQEFIAAAVAARRIDQWSQKGPTYSHSSCPLRIDVHCYLAAAS